MILLEFWHHKQKWCWKSCVIWNIIGLIWYLKLCNCSGESGWLTLKGWQTSRSIDTLIWCSQDGHGTVSYIRMQNGESVHVTFVLGKARVAPLKQMTIPCMALTAAILAVRVDRMLQAEPQESQLKLESSLFWTDSTSVLKYIRNEDKRVHMFVANRISAIRKASNILQWWYVPTAQNPADDASRGLRVEHLLTQHTGFWILTLLMATLW